MFLLTNVQFDILVSGAGTDDHTCIYFFTRSDEQSTTILCREQTVSDRFAGFECDQRTKLTVSNISAVSIIAIENGVDNTITSGIGHKFASVTDQTAGWDIELKSCISAGQRFHIDHFTFALA